VRSGKPAPAEVDRYNIVRVDGLDVYLPKSLFIPGDFTIALWSFLWIKGLTIEGWKLI